MNSQNPEIFNSCKQGDAKAISSVLNQTLSKNSIRSRILLQDKIIKIQLSSDKTINKDKLVNWLKDLLEKLSINNINECHVDFFSPTENRRKWSDSFNLTTSKLHCYDKEKVAEFNANPKKKIQKKSVPTKNKAEENNKKSNHILSKKIAAVSSVLLLTVLAGGIFTYIWDEYISSSSRENEVLNEYLDSLMPYERELAAISVRHCSEDYSSIQIVQNPSLCPKFEEAFNQFCGKYSNEKVCRSASLEDFCEEQSNDVLCLQNP